MPRATVKVWRAGDTGKLYCPKIDEDKEMGDEPGPAANMAVGVTSFMEKAKQDKSAAAPASGKKTGAIKALDAARLAKERHLQQQVAREERKRKVAEALQQKQIANAGKAGAFSYPQETRSGNPG
jgi:hypothetical protein